MPMPLLLHLGQSFQPAAAEDLLDLQLSRCSGTVFLKMVVVVLEMLPELLLLLRHFCPQATNDLIVPAPLLLEAVALLFELRLRSREVRTKPGDQLLLDCELLRQAGIASHRALQFFLEVLDLRPQLLLLVQTQTLLHGGEGSLMLANLCLEVGDLLLALQGLACLRSQLLPKEPDLRAVLLLEPLCQSGVDLLDFTLNHNRVVAELLTEGRMGALQLLLEFPLDLLCEAALPLAAAQLL
mmetsp:Transcript_65503/g.152084  ORF Transcript_65503/g.152084 Transcript_65503/m.152084 type:complete len:240 (-) Transcript_65503:132-851(-)